jgi:GTP pyrophosphokinase
MANPAYDMVMEEKRERQEAHLTPVEEFVSPESLYEELVERIRRYHPSTDLSLVEKAYQVADKSHQGQLRKSGEPYINHPVSVAIILAELEMDKETIVAALLHDVVEDTIVTDMEVVRDFGVEIALLVGGVTKLGQLPYKADKVEEQAENLRKMFLAMAKDIRVILIKLADRLHNMRTLRYMAEDKQIEKAGETLDIYAPIAQRLGISALKNELEDLSLKYLESEAYYGLVDQIDQRKSERDKYINQLVFEVKQHMDTAGIDGAVDGRAKHFFSIYRKMVNQGRTLDQIYDLFAIRIIVDSVKDCYAALGVIHEMYKPIPGRFKDYIAMPKPNMYQSLHTSLIGPTGSPFEIQIRTLEMHRTAEYGIAAHWKYKEGISDQQSEREQEEVKLTWLRQILEWQKEMSDNREFLDLLKSDLDLFSDMVFCFSPKGDVKNLPAGSTPIDFAYTIHSAVGNMMVGARVNGKLVSLNHEIENGDRVEIITSQNSAGPSRDWMNMVKSATAKNKISQWFRSQYKEENITRGKDLLIHYAKSKNLSVSALNRKDFQERIIKRYGFRDWESLLAAIGHGSMKESQVVNRLQEYYKQEQQKELTDQEVMESLEAASANYREHHGKHKKPQSGITVKGLDDVAVRLSKCCSPVPGDTIIGFVTRGRGVSIHRTDCSNILHLSEVEKFRLLDAQWTQVDDSSAQYEVEIHIYCHDRIGLLVDITKIFTEGKLDIHKVHTNTNKQGIATMEIGFAIKGMQDLNDLFQKVRQVEGVIDVQRATG